MAKKKQSEAEKLAKMRGVVTFEYNVGMMLVEADVEKTAAALAALRPGSVLHASAQEKGFKIEKQNLVIARIKGHTWSVVYESKFLGVGALTEADAKEVSKAIGCRAMHYGNSDTACALGYGLYEKGKLLESMNTDESYEILDFKSPGLKTEVDAIEDVTEYVEGLFEELDALEPGLNFHSIAGYIMIKPGDKISLKGIAKDMERIDVVSMDAKSIEQCSKTPEGKKQAKLAKLMDRDGEDEETGDDEE